MSPQEYCKALEDKLAQLERELAEKEADLKACHGLWITAMKERDQLSAELDATKTKLQALPFGALIERAKAWRRCAKTLAHACKSSEAEIDSALAAYKRLKGEQ